MRALLRYIRAALFFIRYSAALPSQQWTPEDEAALALFFGSNAGRKFRLLVESWLASENSAATQSMLPLKCAWVSGARGLHAQILSLLPPASASTAQPEELPGLEELLERHSP